MSLRVENLSQRFGRQAALDHVTIHVERGDCYGFIGHNGAGKTTTMRIMLGLLPISSGRVIVDSFDAAKYPREARARMGALIERPGFHGGWSGKRNLALLDRLAGKRSDIDALLGLVGLGEVGRKPVRAYSQGMRQRLGVAQALLGDPDYILLDEPTNGLDPDGILEMRALLLRLTREEKKTVFVSSHQLHELSGVCNRVGVLRSGRLVVEEDLDRLLNEGFHSLRTGSDGRARELLEARGVVVVETGREGLVLELGEIAPGEIVKGLVAGGVEVESFSPKPASLEEVYRRERGPVHQPVAAAVVGPPREKKAPSLAVLRMIRHEFARWCGNLAVPLLLAVPAVAGVLHIFKLRSEALANAAKVASGELASAPVVSAFEGVASALCTGLPILVYLVLGLASQSLSGEFSQGTLRNVLLRPLRRWQVVAGKGLALIGLTLGAYLFLAAVAIGAASWAFDWVGYSEILPNGKLFEMVGADELRPDFRHALLSPLLPLAAMAGIGFLAGTLLRRSAAALGVAIVFGLLLDSARGVERGLTPFVPPSYLPSMGRSSFLDFFRDLTTGISNTLYELQAHEIWVPLAWTAATFALAYLVFRQRQVP